MSQRPRAGRATRPMWRDYCPQHPDTWVRIEECSDDARAVYRVNQLRRSARRWPGLWDFSVAHGWIRARWRPPARRAG